MSYSIFHFRIYFLFFYFFKIYEHSKYIIIYQTGNFWNFDSFPDCQILKISWFSKLKNFRNSIFLWISQQRKFDAFRKCKIWDIFGVVKFSKLTNSKIFLKNQNFPSKIGKFWNCLSIRYFALLAILSIPIFARHHQ